MNFYTRIFMAALCGATLIATAACSDDETSTTAAGGSGATGGSGGSGAAGGAGGSGGSAALTCQTGCELLYSCGTEMDANMMQLCPAFVAGGVEEADFVPGCVDSCNMDDTLLGVLDPGNCSGNVSIAKAGSAAFKTACEGGGQGGAGGGTGGGGGAGGN